MSARLRATPWFRDEKEEAEARAARRLRINYPTLSEWLPLMSFTFNRQNQDLYRYLDNKMRLALYIWRGNPV